MLTPNLGFGPNGSSFTTRSGIYPDFTGYSATRSGPSCAVKTPREISRCWDGAVSLSGVVHSSRKSMNHTNACIIKTSKWRSIWHGACKLRKSEKKHSQIDESDPEARALSHWIAFPTSVSDFFIAPFVYVKDYSLRNRLLGRELRLQTYAA